MSKTKGYKQATSGYGGSCKGKSPDMVVHTYNRNTGEAEAGGSQIQG